MRFITSLAAFAALTVTTPAFAQNAEVGKRLFDQYCSSCHGLEGKGDGAMAEFLNIKPSDLTALSAANDGEYPMLKVIHIIDGRTGVRGHGGDMPVFGDVFMEEGGHDPNSYTDVLETRGRVLSLATYLESIQQ
ncbi:c-type cytochrome [Thioclava pacifica]|uniref:Cytochrome c domain-containing protein n=1 Tax=Thioclava pacifica DSM 10166 TaxID=1353537 RepID=A0A074JYJ9_9RHOB|nr:cytochrome c [Thioclava pacifica]KEO54432.1 hypothetical protein TP2_05760 [Thioclava pacifica DSM 10166]